MKSQIKHLLKYELLQHVYSMKFITMSCFAIVFGILCVTIQLMDYKDRKTVYNEERLKAEQGISEATVYSQLAVPIIVKPNPLSIFVRGSDDKIGNKIVISVFQVPQFEASSQKKNPFMAIFTSFDLITLVIILFSIMALFLVADTIAGEREAGTLKQTFSNSLLKSKYFLAKYVSSLLIIAIPLTLLFLIAGLIIQILPFIALSGTEWLTVFMLYLCSLCFISIYILIGLFISARSSSASMATLMGLLIWIVLVFIYPNITRYFVHHAVRIPTMDVITGQIETMEDNLSERVRAAFPDRPPGSASYSWYSLGEYNLPSIIGITEKRHYGYHGACVKRGIPIIQEGQNEIYQTLWAFKQQFITQRTLTDRLNHILPGSFLLQSTSKIAGTHYQRRDLDILSHAKQYRDQFLDYVQSKQGFGLHFFTQMPEEEMRLNWDDYAEGIREKYSPDQYAPLNTDDMPVFRIPRKQFIPSESLIDLLFLILMNIILFIGGGLLFNHSEVRIRG